ncbi:hypothetical protein BDW22DRAFT_582066 [Trametopsis cervina]|nr:hypothetical protein BDW22DRAFT_582066 [Trametopsis cervina]
MDWHLPAPGVLKFPFADKNKNKHRSCFFIGAASAAGCKIKLLYCTAPPHTVSLSRTRTGTGRARAANGTVHHVVCTCYCTVLHVGSKRKRKRGVDIMSMRNQAVFIVEVCTLRSMPELHRVSAGQRVLSHCVGCRLYFYCDKDEGKLNSVDPDSGVLWTRLPWNKHTHPHADLAVGMPADCVFPHPRGVQSTSTNTSEPSRLPRANKNRHRAFPSDRTGQDGCAAGCDMTSNHDTVTRSSFQNRTGTRTDDLRTMTDDKRRRAPAAAAVVLYDIPHGPARPTSSAWMFVIRHSARLCCGSKH